METTVSPVPTVTIGANAFEPSQTNGSILCVEVGRDRFRFLVQNARRQVCVLEDYTFPSLLNDHLLTGLLPALIREHPVLSAGPWQGIRVAVNSSTFTLVPASLFRKEYAGSYLTLMRGGDLLPHEFAHFCAHHDEGFLSVFSLEHPVADFFAEMYPLQPITFVQQTDGLLWATASLARHTLAPDQVWLYFEDEFVTIIYRHQQTLRYCNRVGYRNAQDLTYYVLYVLDELKLLPETTAVNLYGEITPFADAYTELGRFLPNLTFGSVPPNLNATAEFTELPDHRYLALYGLSLISEL
ncbi:MAG: DUF3822 family protein [Spirosoma sp.]|nr:DUF3822 family protein [Spirosoma sp.]